MKGVKNKKEVVTGKKPGKMNKKKSSGNVPVSWFIGAIVIAVFLSFVISLILVNMVQPAGQDYSLDSGSIVVQIRPDMSAQGKIVVDIEGDKKEVSSNAS